MQERNLHHSQAAFGSSVSKRAISNGQSGALDLDSQKFLMVRTKARIIKAKATTLAAHMVYRCVLVSLMLGKRMVPVRMPMAKPCDNVSFRLAGSSWSADP